MKKIRLAVTGFRSHKLFGKDYNDPRYIKIINTMLQYLNHDEMITDVNIGMATGIDLLMGLAVIKFNATIQDRIKLHCFIPGNDQTDNYSEKELEIYEFILKHAHSVTQISRGKCTKNSIRKRNAMMISPDNCNRLLSFWDMKSFKSGTKMTINMATKNDITVYNIDPFDVFDYGYLYVSTTERDQFKLKNALPEEARGYASELEL